MAKYEVKFSCGHTETVSLFGKDTERKRKIEWYEENGYCSECYKAMMQAEPIEALIEFSCKENMYVVILSGNTYNTYAHKDSIKANGFKWDGDHWIKYAESEFDCKNIVKSLDFAVEVKTSKMIEKHKQIAQEIAKQESERESEIEKIKATKPEKPRCVADGSWNGKIYGSEKYGYNVYIDSKKRNLSPEEYDEIKQYKKDMAKYKERLASV